MTGRRVAGWHSLLGAGLLVDMGCMWLWCAKLATTAGRKGFRLTWFVVMGRFPFDRAAGYWMAWFVGSRALGRHGLHVAVVC